MTCAPAGTTTTRRAILQTARRPNIFMGHLGVESRPGYPAGQAWRHRVETGGVSRRRNNGEVNGTASSWIARTPGLCPRARLHGHVGLLWITERWRVDRDDSPRRRARRSEERRVGKGCETWILGESG